MAGNVGDRQRIQQEIERNKERIRKLTLEIKSDISSNENRIKTLEVGEETQKERIKTLEDKNQALEDRNKALQQEIDELKNKNKSLEKKLKRMEEKFEKLEQYVNQEKSVLIIAQIGPAIQRNICKYVLGKHFKAKNKFYKVVELEDYIAEINDAEEQELAEERRNSVLEDKNFWDQSLVDTFKELNQTRIGIAHPKLTSEKIQQARDCLKEDLEEEMFSNITKLMNKWIASESLSQEPNPSESANEKQVQGAEPVERKQPTYANKISGILIVPLQHGLLGSQGDQH